MKAVKTAALLGIAVTLVLISPNQSYARGPHGGGGGMGHGQHSWGGPPNREGGPGEGSVRSRGSDQDEPSGEAADMDDAGKAGTPAGLAKHAENPPKGWSQGEKKGWKGEDAPPGLLQRFKNLFSGNKSSGEQK